MNNKPFMPEDFPYTLVHDDLAPIIAKMRGASIKLLFFIMRMSRDDFTHFKRVRLGFATISQGSGIPSYETISIALQQLSDLSLIRRYEIGRAHGINTPLYEYELNLEFDVTETVKGVTETVTRPTMQSADLLQSASNIIEQGESGLEDHDHERDLPLDKEDLLTRFVSVIGLKNSLAHQLIERMGLESAWLWYGFVLDSRNKIGSAASYLYTCCIAKQSEPPISYTRDEIDALERRYVQQNLAADAVELAEVIHTVADDLPGPGPQDNGLGGLWNRTLHELQAQMTVSAFNQWLAQTRLISIQEGQARVIAHNGYAKEWLSTRLKPPILRTLAAIAGNAGHVVQDVIFETEEP